MVLVSPLLWVEEKELPLSALLRSVLGQHWGTPCKSQIWKPSSLEEGFPVLSVLEQAQIIDLGWVSWAFSLLYKGFRQQVQGFSHKSVLVHIGFGREKSHVKVIEIKTQLFVCTEIVPLETNFIAS